MIRYEPGCDELDDLVRKGLMRWSRTQMPLDFWKRARPADPEGRLLGTLLEERDANR